MFLLCSMKVRLSSKRNRLLAFVLFSTASASTHLIPVKTTIRHAKTVAWAKERLNKLIDEQKQRVNHYKNMQTSYGRGVNIRH